MMELLTNISEGCIIAYVLAFGIAGLRQMLINKEKAVGVFEIVGMLWRGEVQPSLKVKMQALVSKNCELMDKIHVLEEKLNAHL
jgi:hypothetical protein